MAVSWVSTWKRFPNWYKVIVGFFPESPWDFALAVGLTSSQKLLWSYRSAEAGCRQALIVSQKDCIEKARVASVCPRGCPPAFASVKGMQVTLSHPLTVDLSLCLRRHRASSPSPIIRAHPVSVPLENKSNFLECKKRVSSFNHSQREAGRIYCSCVVYSKCLKISGKHSGPIKNKSVFYLVSVYEK